MDFREFKKTWKKVWHFIWEDDSLLSWLVNIALAFVIVKFLIYPGLGLMLGTTHPVVAVVSGSMEHEGFGFEDWWFLNKDYYRGFNITKEEFSEYIFKNGFNKGDLIVLGRTDQIKKGDVIVFRNFLGDPIIHRAVIADYKEGTIFLQTKGDNNDYSREDEIGIPESSLIGKAKYRIPYLGWFKLGFLKLIGRA